MHGECMHTQYKNRINLMIFNGSLCSTINKNDIIFMRNGFMRDAYTHRTNRNR